MKPTNTKIPPCNPISSNCVIWQGPDVECIGLCKGDTVSDVVAKLATELCKLLEELKISTFDLSCLGTPGCPPASFHDLIQLIIDKICEQNDIPTTDSNVCPPCVVPVASCLQYVDPATGDTVVQTLLVNYVQLIANRLCALVEQIETVANAGARTSGSTTVVNNVVDIPTVVPQCVLTPGVPTDINLVVSALESQFCNLLGAVGSPTNIYNVLTRECTDLGNQEKLYGSGIMSSIPGWIIGERTLADNLNNMWLTICDIRAKVIDIALNCCPGCCDGIEVTMTASLFSTTTLRIYLNGTITPGFVECNSNGTAFTITDGLGASITINIPVSTFINNPSGYPVNITTTPLNPAGNFTINAVLCMTPEDATSGCSECQSILSYTLINNASCPPVQIIPSLTNIAYTFQHLGSTATYTAELWNSAINVLIASQTIPVVAPQTVSGLFSGLTAGTTYYFRLKITVGTNTTNCGYVQTGTIPNPCPPPTNVSTTFEYAPII